MGKNENSVSINGGGTNTVREFNHNNNKRQMIDETPLRAS
jgi:hypothetical protein